MQIIYPPLSQTEITDISEQVSAASISTASAAANIGDGISFQTQNNALNTVITVAGLGGYVPINAVFLQITDYVPKNFNLSIGTGIIQDVNAIAAAGILLFNISVSGEKVGGGSDDFRVALARDSDDDFKLADILESQAKTRSFDGPTGNLAFSVKCSSGNNFKYKLYVANMTGAGDFLASSVIVHCTRVGLV